MLIRVDQADDDRLSDYRLLHGAGALRTQVGEEFFVAEGWTAIDRTLDSGHELRSVLLLTSRVERLEAQHPELAVSEVPIYVVERSVLEGSVGFDLHRGVLASAIRRPAPTIDELAATSRRLAVLEGLNDAENVGLIARAARALGVDGLVLDPTCTDPYARRAVRVSMGEILHLPAARATAWPAALGRLADGGFETWALTPAPTADDIWSRPVPDRLALVLGAEGPGLTVQALAHATHRVRIPISAEVDSLNVGHAAAISFAITARKDDR